MSAPVFPSVFVSHGSPTLILEPDSPGRAFLAGLGQRLGRPTAILAVSAHWMTRQPQVSTAERPETIYDFYGFPDALYRMTYPAPGAPALAERVRDLLVKAGFPAGTDPEQGLDHGAWVPLRLMYPDADIPVAQVSILPGQSGAVHLALGRALAPLRREGVLILGSGGAVHNLRQFRFGGGTLPPWAADFAGWLDRVAVSGDTGAVAQWEQAPAALMAHPSDDHFLPFAVAMGAGIGDGGDGPQGERLHGGFEHGSLGMHAYAFHTAGEAAGAMGA